MATLEVRLPDFVEQGASGGLGFQTTIRVRFSGHETTFQNWEDSRGEWDISYGAHYMNAEVSLTHYLQPVLDLFGAARGMMHSFLFKDWTDYQIPPGFSADEKSPIGLGDGATVVFQAVRIYDAGVGDPYNRIIEKIESNTDRAWIEGTELTRVASGPAPGEYSIDVTTGKITTGDVPAATGGSGPLGEQVVYLQCEFNCHVRFGVDHIDLAAISADANGSVISIPRLPLVEKKPKE